MEIVVRETPTLNDGSELALLEAEFGRARRLIEYGSGGSTIFAATRGVREIVSVESDPAWAREVDAAATRFRPACDIRVIHCDLGPVWTLGTPRDRSKIEAWPGYMSAPWEGYSGLPDLVYVDGRFRVACALYSLLMFSLARTSQPLRMAVHDFKSRPHYHRILSHAEVVAEAGELFVFEPSSTLDSRALLKGLLEFQFDWQ